MSFNIGSASSGPLFSALLAHDVIAVKKELQKITSQERANELLNGICSSPFGSAPLHIAALNNDKEILKLLLNPPLESLKAAQSSFQVNVNVADKDGHAPLHFAANEGAYEVAEILLAHPRCELNPLNNDMLLRLNNIIPIYVTGGKTPLHLAAESGEEELVTLLLSKKANRAIRDNDGNTPAILAALNDRPEIAQLLLQEEDTNSQHRAFVQYLLSLQQSERKKIFSQQENFRRFRINATVEYQKQQGASEDTHQQEMTCHVTCEKRSIGEDILKLHKHPGLLDLAANQSIYFDDRYLQAIEQLKSSLDKSNQLSAVETEQFKQRFGIEEVVPGVYEFGWMFSSDFRQQMVEDLEELMTAASAQGLVMRRPNSMNNFGLVLDDMFGFHELFRVLRQQHIAVLTRLLFPNVLRAKEFNEHHAFLIQYQLGEDESLDEHVDNSLITLNVCLGHDFTGGKLYFRSPPSAHDDDNPGDVINEHQSAQSVREGGDVRNLYMYTPKVGKAILHLGAHSHGVTKLESGKRCNVIVWCRSKSSHCPG